MPSLIAFLRLYRDLLAYGRHSRSCAATGHCVCGLEIAERRAERVLGFQVFPKSYLRTDADGHEWLTVTPMPTSDSRCGRPLP